MAVEPNDERAWWVTLIRALLSVIGFSLASVVLYVIYYGVRGELPWAHLPFALVVTVASMVIPGSWAVVGGVLFDHWLAPRGPWWAMLIHPLGLAAIGLVTMGKFAGVPSSGYLGEVAFSAGVPAVIGMVGVFLTWLVPGSFPRKGRVEAWAP